MELRMLKFRLIPGVVGLLLAAAGCDAGSVALPLRVSAPPPSSTAVLPDIAPSPATQPPTQQPRPTPPPGYCCLEIKISVHDGGQVELVTADGKQHITYPRNRIGSDFDVFPFGTTAVLTANSRWDYRFRFWGGDAMGQETPTITITLDKDTSVIAFFDCEDG